MILIKTAFELFLGVCKFPFYVVGGVIKHYRDVDGTYWLESENEPFVNEKMN